jgi:DNA-binding MarR family transcriptional regulator
MDDYGLKYKMAGSLEATITGKYIYTLLCDYAGAKGRIQISIGKISKLLNISRTAIRRNLHRLEESGYILIHTKSDDDGTRKANVYEMI